MKTSGYIYERFAVHPLKYQDQTAVDNSKGLDEQNNY